MQVRPTNLNARSELSIHYKIIIIHEVPTQRRRTCHNSSSVDWLVVARAAVKVHDFLPVLLVAESADDAFVVEDALTVPGLLDEAPGTLSMPRFRHSSRSMRPLQVRVVGKRMISAAIDREAERKGWKTYFAIRHSR